MEKLNTPTEASSSCWLSDLLLQEMDDCNFFQQCNPNLLGDEEFLSHDIVSAFQSDNLQQQQQPLSSESYSSYPVSNSETVWNSSTDETCFERPAKQQKTKHVLPDQSNSSSPSSPTSQILSFENTHLYGLDCSLNPNLQNEGVSVSTPQLRNVNFPAQNRKGSTQNQNFETITNPQGKGSKKSHGQDHIIAERRRREKLSQSLIALAALIPGLKKMDKASVLGDAIKYVKVLKERLRLLEEQNKNRAMESVVVVNKPQISNDDNSSSSCDDGTIIGSEEALPHVEARVSEKDVLLRLHCKKQKGLLLKILFEIQNLHLFVVNSSVLPFGDSILDITIVAQIGAEYNLTINELVKNLRVAALRSMSS
ncbi:transcription factor bHLH18-like [Lotus japonicus]|uniref:transcription factor bHLH18-like n=1 Tax=Lotus japonicus TaxID=34305 RepID=UPI00258F44BB|nr:transcription factor bHLH18-like [Lotus japonicus]